MHRYRQYLSTFSRLLVSTTAVSLLAGCGVIVPIQPVFKMDQKISGTVSPALRSFVKTTSAPKVVLRVPNVVTSLVQAESQNVTNFNQIYSVFEEKMLSEGLVVRDRALLQQMLSSGATDYASLGRKIDTDLIIEITKLTFSQLLVGQKLPDHVSTQDFVTADQVRGTMDEDESRISLIAEFEARIITVKSGDVSGFIKLKAHACEFTPCAMKLDQRSMGVRYFYGPFWFGWTRESEAKAAEYFASALVSRLRGDL